MTQANVKTACIAATLAVFAGMLVMETVDARGRGGGFSRGGPASAGGFSAGAGRVGQRARGGPSLGSSSGRDRSGLGDATEDRREYRQDARDDWREHKQDAVDDRREFRQDVAEDHWDDHRHWDDDAGAFVAGALVGGAIGAAVASTNTYVATLPCAPATVVVGGVTYVIVDPPPGF